MKLSADGLNFLKQWEGFSARVYRDAGGYRTIGYGHKLLPGEKFSIITEQQASDLLTRDVAWAESTVNLAVRVPLSQSQFDALVSLVYNWGPGNFRNSTHLQRLNNRDYVGTAERIRMHPITSGGKNIQGLINRRNAEADLFLRGTTPSLPQSPMPGSDNSPSNTNLIAWPLMILAGGALLLAILAD